MTDEEYYSLKFCPNCRNNKIIKIKGDNKKRKCWKCYNYDHFEQSDNSKQKLKNLKKNNNK